MVFSPRRRHTWPQLRACARIVALAIALGVLTPTLSEAAVSVTINWQRSTDPVTVGYYVLYGTESRNYTASLNVGNTTTAVIYLPDPTRTYYFAVQGYSATGERGPLSSETIWTPAQALTLRNPGNQTGAVGLTITPLQLSATDPRALPLTYSAGGLPPGLSISSNTGRIFGTPTSAGSFTVFVAATNSSGVSASEMFTWTIVGPSGGGGIPGGGGSVGTPPPGSGGVPGGGVGDGGSGNTGGGGDGTSTPPVTPGLDVAPPKVIVTSPTTDGGTYRTTNVRIIVTGTASDNVGVVSVMWANSRGGAGSALGTSSWATTPIDLKLGDNVLTITVADAAGNVETVTLNVTRIVDLENYLN
jgi:hypothetical protein